MAQLWWLDPLRHVDGRGPSWLLMVAIQTIRFVFGLLVIFVLRSFVSSAWFPEQAARPSYHQGKGRATAGEPQHGRSGARTPGSHLRGAVTPQRVTGRFARGPARDSH